MYIFFLNKSFKLMTQIISSKTYIFAPLPLEHASLHILIIFYNKYELLIYKYYFLESHYMTIYKLNYTFIITNNLIF